MSYDVWLVEDQDGAEREMWWRNHTSNTAKMWHLAMERSGHPGMAIWDTGGMRGSEAGAVLEDALGDMQAYSPLYEPMNPPNGWGSYESAMQFLWETVEACRRYPDAIIRWSI